ncbi:hypothetical protein P7C70_g6777, partial [Phenoliferia sp. Uapishka_3]
MRPMMANRIFVRGVPLNVHDSSVRGYFSQFGSIVEWEQPADRDFLFVTFNESQSATAAKRSVAPFLGHRVLIESALVDRSRGSWGFGANAFAPYPSGPWYPQPNYHPRPNSQIYLPSIPVNPKRLETDERSKSPLRRRSNDREPVSRGRRSYGRGTELKRGREREGTSDHSRHSGRSRHRSSSRHSARREHRSRGHRFEERGHSRGRRRSRSPRRNRREDSGQGNRSRWKRRARSSSRSASRSSSRSTSRRSSSTFDRRPNHGRSSNSEDKGHKSSLLDSMIHMDAPTPPTRAREPSHDANATVASVRPTRAPTPTPTPLHSLIHPERLNIFKGVPCVQRTGAYKSSASTVLNSPQPSPRSVPPYQYVHPLI